MIEFLVNGERVKVNPIVKAVVILGGLLCAALAVWGALLLGAVIAYSTM